MTAFNSSAILKSLGVSATGLCGDSREIRRGEIFLACPGEIADGRHFIPQAIEKGASAILWERENFRWRREWKITNAAVNGLRRHSGEIADCFYNSPSRQMVVVAVTGTNGKTTTAFFAAQLLTKLGIACGFVGTVGTGFASFLVPAERTTPDAVALHKTLSHFRRQGAKAAAIEASSHGLSQGRLDAVKIDVAVFTGISRDHLDYHGDFAAYLQAKERLFDSPKLSAAVINVDDENGIALASRLKKKRIRILTFGKEGGGDINLMNCGGGEMEFTVDSRRFIWKTPMPGKHNALNLLASSAVVMMNDSISVQGGWDGIGKIASALSPPRGRLERIDGEKNAPLVFVDYAHTPDALRAALSAIKEGGGGESCGRIICVFGCGGERDSGKRALMGEIAADLADSVFITSDNPRNESPDKIIADILVGAGDKAKVIPSREEAIAAAIKSARPGDSVLIAGKGHEEYQEINGARIPFSDAAVARKNLRTYSGNDLPKARRKMPSAPPFSNAQSAHAEKR